MEYVQLGDLEKNVMAHSGKIPEIDARDITEQILSGLEIMHAQFFAHRDLKPQVCSLQKFRGTFQLIQYFLEHISRQWRSPMVNKTNQL
jgi:serine/threonine protein kinase